jgi:transcriptional regulator with XRE-family HTH domain
MGKQSRHSPGSDDPTQREKWLRAAAPVRLSKNSGPVVLKWIAGPFFVLSREVEIMKLKEAREAMNMTQAALCQRIGLNQAHLSLAETGVKILNMKNMLLIERELGSRIDWEDACDLNEKVEVVQAIASLVDRYPVFQVLHFCAEILADKRSREPVQKLSFYARVTHEEASLLPSGVE